MRVQPFRVLERFKMVRTDPNQKGPLASLAPRMAQSNLVVDNDCR
jgi:hypothetical protein